MTTARWIVLALVTLLAAGAAGCDSGERSTTAPLVAVERAFGAIEFNRPIEVGAYRDDRLFVAEQGGRVVTLRLGGAKLSELLDIGGRVDDEIGEGLLSVALDPEFATTGWLWVYYYTAGPPRTVLARYTVADDRADPESALVVLEIPQPGANQNGGSVRFGRDGMLYLSVGDGSASFDPFENGQDPSTLLGGILRLDVREASEASPYRVPDDNPFLDVSSARPELWAYGMRNPWRMAFDAATGELWGGDVMASKGEEVNRYEAGGNYGWNIRQGFECLNFPPCRSEGLTPPVATYEHGDARCAVIGGVVYRGDAIDGLDGWYVFGDYCSGELLAIDAVAPGDRPEPQTIAEELGPISTFGLGRDGAIYVAGYEGTIWRVVPR